jgi:tetratricopeptide (TPR) repeat protein/energy-coupling factor transporter ATP-binding protein EcfA2
MEGYDDDGDDGDDTGARGYGDVHHTMRGSSDGMQQEDERVEALRIPEGAPEWSPAELERYLHVVAMERHTASSIGRRELLDELHAHVEHVGNPNPLLLLGPPGSGKSTALAALVSEIQTATGRMALAGSAASSLLPAVALPAAAGADAGDDEDPAVAGTAATLAAEPFVLVHTFGLSAAGQSDDFRRVLLRLCAELKARFNIYVDLPDTLAEVAGALPRFLAHAALFGKVVLILDGLERADMRGVEQGQWMPSSLPLAVRVIVASSRCRAASAVREQSGQLLQEVAVAPLSSDERRGILIKALATVADGRMQVGMLGPLLEKDDAGLPMYLLVAVQEIKARMRDTQDRDTQDVHAAAEDANALPPTMAGILGALYDRLEGRYGLTLVAEAVTLLACSRGGLRNDEVLSLLHQTSALANMPPAEWDGLRGELEPYCWPPDRLPGEPVLCFFHQQVCAFAMRRYASAAAEKQQQHRRLSATFSDPALAPSHRHVGEALWAMREGGEWYGLWCHLTDPRVHALLWNQDTQVDLHNHWEALLKGEGEQQAAHARGALLLAGPGGDGGGDAAPPRPPRRRRDIVAEYERQADLASPSADGVLGPDVYKELLADYLMWANLPAEAAFVLRMLSEAKGDAADLAAVSVNFKLGRALGRQGLHLEAEETLRRALAAEQLLVGAETPMVAEIVTEICKVKREEGDMEKAGQLAAHAVSVWEATETAGYEEADVKTLVAALVGLAEMCELLDRTTAAEAAYERALERLEYMLGPDHPEVAEHLSVMAASYKNHGEWEKAEFCYCRALAFAHRFTGPQSLHISHFYNSLAELHRAQGDLPHAQALYQRALQVIESILGATHPEVATYLNNLAELLRVQGKLAEAEPLYKRALAIDESSQGVSHPIIAIRLNNLAELFRDRGRLEEAEPLYQRALAIDLAALGSNHPNIATYLNNLAGLYKARQMWDKAADHYNRAIAIDEKALGPNHPDVAIYLNNLAGLYKGQGRLEEAEPLYLRALRINEEALGSEHIDMAIYFNNIALLYKAQGKLRDARLYYEQAIDIGERTLGSDHPQLATRMANLGALLVDLEDLAGAEKLFSRSLDIRRRVLGDDHADTINCEDWLDSVADMMEELAAETRLPEAPEYTPADEPRREPRDSYDVRLQAMALEEETRTAEENQGTRAASQEASQSMQPRDSFEARLMRKEEQGASTSEAADPGEWVSNGASTSPAAAAAPIAVAGSALALASPPNVVAMSQRREEFLAANASSAPNMRITTSECKQGGPGTDPPDSYPSRRVPRHTIAPALSSHAHAQAVRVAPPRRAVPYPASPSASSPEASTPRDVQSAVELSQELRSSGDAVEAAAASIDAMFRRQQHPEAARDRASPPSSPPPQHQARVAPASRMAVPTSPEHPQEQEQEPGADASEVGMQSPSHMETLAPAGVTVHEVDYQTPPAATTPAVRQPVPVRESTPEVESTPGLAEAALDAFLSAHVEYLGNRQYRCVLDGKILSKFSIMRVHVAKKFGGLVHQWAVDQRVIDRRLPSPAALGSATVQADGLSPVRSVALPPALSPVKLGTPLSGGGHGSGSKLPLSARSQALKRVEELEEELVRLRTYMSSTGVSPTRYITAPAPMRIDGEEHGEPRSAVPIKLHVAHPVRSPALPGSGGHAGSPSGLGFAPPPGYPPHQPYHAMHGMQPHHAPYGGAAHPGAQGGAPYEGYWPPPVPYYPYYGMAGDRGGGYPGAAAPLGSLGSKGDDGGSYSAEDRAMYGPGGGVEADSERVYYAIGDGVGAPGPAAAAAAADGDGGYGGAGGTNPSKLFGVTDYHNHGGRSGGAGGNFRGGGGSPHKPYPRGANFADMLTSERGPDPFAPYRPGEAHGAVQASAGFHPGGGTDLRGPGDGVAPIGSEASRRLARYTSPTRRAESQLVALMGSRTVDRLGLFMSARSQQLARRKFLCEIDGKVFSTMNLMRIHFERHFEADADTWWRQQLHMDPTAG